MGKEKVEKKKKKSRHYIYIYIVLDPFLPILSKCLEMLKLTCYLCYDFISLDLVRIQLMFMLEESWLKALCCKVVVEIE